MDIMSAQWVLGEYRRRPAREDGLWMHVDALGEEVREANQRIKELEKENAALNARLQALHRRQFKANRATPAVASQRQAGQACDQHSKCCYVGGVNRHAETA